MFSRTFVEIDLDIAESGGSFGDSFDQESFDPESFAFGGEEIEVQNTFRFAYADEEVQFDSIPALENVSVTPGVVDPGQSIGMRATVTVTLKDFQYPLAGSDFFTGTFFGKLRAIKPSLQGTPFRLIRGEDGQSIDEMVTEHYVVESMSRSGDRVKIVAKDILKLADGDRSQAPALSNGRLLSAIDESDSSLQLTPAGIGDLEYPASGKVAIGGSEIVSFTRTGDTMNITRAQSGTDAESHDEDDLVQLVLEYDSQSPADIVFDLLTEYTSVEADWCPLDEWKEDIDTYIGRLYSAEIAEATSVTKLLNEIIVQAGLVMWWDEVAQKVRLKSLRPVTGTRVIREDEMLADTFSFSEQPQKRRSQAWTYFALRNPLERLDDTQNFTSGLVTVDSASDQRYGQAAICKTFCRWIQKNNRPAASRLNTLMLSRYTDPPRKFSFDLSREASEPQKGDPLKLVHHSLQNMSGNLVQVPVQVTAVEKTDTKYRVDCEEMLFTDIQDPELSDGGTRLIIIDSNSYNVNLRDLFDSIYTGVDEYDSVLCVIEEGVFVGSTNTGSPAFDVGDWPAAVDITLAIKGRIQGRGGDGSLAFPGFVGKQGGPALFTRYPITLDNEGEISGGGGGGGGSSFAPAGQRWGGGGGAGFDPGLGGPNAGNGTTETGGLAGSSFGGNGGGKGEPGALGAETGGGVAGRAIDGVSFVTFIQAGEINGPQVN